MERTFDRGACSSRWKRKKRESVRLTESERAPSFSRPLIIIDQLKDRHSIGCPVFFLFHIVVMSTSDLMMVMVSGRLISSMFFSDEQTNRTDNYFCSTRRLSQAIASCVAIFKDRSDVFDANVYLF